MKTWTEALGEEKQKAYFQQILQYVHNERLAGKVIYPPQNEVFSAFALTEFSDVKVVILGQDPYHGPNQAHGLAFSVKPPVARHLLWSICIKNYLKILKDFKFHRMAI